MALRVVFTKTTLLSFQVLNFLGSLDFFSEIDFQADIPKL